MQNTSLNIAHTSRSKGFISIPVLIAIVCGFVAIGALTFIYLDKKETPAERNQEANNASSDDSQSAEINDLKQQVDELRQQQTKTQQQTPPAKQDSIVSTKKLSNAEIISKNKSGVVYIQTSSGSGSGMIIDSAGSVLTNAHVVIGVDDAQIKLSDGRILAAKVVGRDEITDVALLKVSAGSLSPVELGDSSKVTQGDNVFTLGYPFGLEGDVSFKDGTISRTITTEGVTYLETSAEIHPGNSGGPLVNDRGQVIGINTLTYGIGVNGVIVGESLKLAIPINVARSKITYLESGGSNLKWSQLRAFGVVTIFNETNSSQRLIRSTRLQSPDGKIYRLTQDANLPPMINGKAGSVNVTVFADKPGAEYNLPPTTFKIPGFLNDPRYNLIYGKSFTPMTGGK